MPSYVITGVSRGLGWEFLRQLSADPKNVVIGIVRNKPPTDKKVSEELGDRANITIVEADITNYNALKVSAEITSKVTDGSLDYLVVNAGSLSHWDNYDSIGDLNEDPQLFEKELTTALHGNITCQIHLINLYMPLILKGNVKKVIAMTSGHADFETVRKYDVDAFPIYSISKAGLNMAIAKFSAQYREQGVLFLSMSPGIVEVGHHSSLNQHQIEAMTKMSQKFMAYAPNFKGLSTPEDAIKAVISVWENATIEKGNGGAFLSHRGETGNWL